MRAVRNLLLDIGFMAIIDEKLDLGT